MSIRGLQLAQDKMRAAGASSQSIEAFTHYYRQLEQGTTGLIHEDDIEPLTHVDALSATHIDPLDAQRALDQTVLIRLNGGLASSMGMDHAKSLLPVRDGKSFLDLIIAQIRYARERWNARLPLLLMNSFRTRTDTLNALAAYPDLPVENLPLDFLQNQQPKLRADTLEPVAWGPEPSLEWCPPGHGDIYTTLLSTGLIEQLLDHGFRYANTANADNLGAAPDPDLAGWFAASNAAHHKRGCRGGVIVGGASCRGEGRGLPMMGVLTQPVWKTSTCLTLPSLAPT